MSQVTSVRTGGHLAQLIQNNAKEAGSPSPMPPAATARRSTAGRAGLYSTMGITDYGHRGIVNVFLGAPLHSDGTWNRAYLTNKQYDALVKDFTAQSMIDAQMQAASKIQKVLFDETPIMIPYFYDVLSGVRKGFAGVEMTGMAHIQLTGVGQAA